MSQNTKVSRVVSGKPNTDGASCNTNGKIKLPEMTPEVAKELWSLNTVPFKKSVLLKYMGEEYNTKAEGRLRMQIKQCKSNDELDIIISNMVMKADGKGVI